MIGKFPIPGHHVILLWNRFVACSHKTSYEFNTNDLGSSFKLEPTMADRPLRNPPPDKARPSCFSSRPEGFGNRDRPAPGFSSRLEAHRHRTRAGKKPAKESFLDILFSRNPEDQIALPCPVHDLYAYVLPALRGLLAWCSSWMEPTFCVKSVVRPLMDGVAGLKLSFRAMAATPRWEY